MDSLAILQRFGTGELIDKLAEALCQTADEVIETGNPGKVTLTLSVNALGKEGTEVIVTPTINRATPKRESRAAIFFAHEGDLYRDDPRQIKMDFRSVDTTTGVIQDVPSERIERTVE